MIGITYLLASVWRMEVTVMDSRICAAIEGRQVVTIEYGGGTRTIEPHCHGISRAGKEALRAYQSSGFSRRNEPDAWKFLTVSKIGSLVATGTTFPENRDGYNPNDEHMTSIHCHV